MYQMAIANRLQDGLVVFLANDDRWVEAIADGCLAVGDASAEALLERAMRGVPQCQVVDPYLIEVTDINGVRRPVVYREAIRALGPTVDAETG